MLPSFYRYNRKTLQFEKIDLSEPKRLFQIIAGLASTVVVLVGLVLTVLFTVFDIKTSSMLKSENDLLQTQFEQVSSRLDQVNQLVAELEKRDDKLYRFLLNAKPIPQTVRSAGFGGSNKYKKFENSSYSEILTETAKKLDILSKKVVVQSKSYDEIIRLASEQGQMLLHIPALQPVSLNQSQLTSGFGIRNHPVYGHRKMHTGLDFSAPVGTPVYAPGDGKVISCQYSSGYGNEILVSHGYGYVTRYAHLQKMKVREGQKVKRGDIIATVGNTGISTGAHLHYEIIKDGQKINPLGFFFPDVTPEEFHRDHEASNLAR